MKIKSLLFLALYLMAALSCFSQSGTTGDLTWKIEDGTLTISGKGTMPDYRELTPWDEYKMSIVKVVIENGVTSIGRDAFWSCTGLTSVAIPNSVISIGSAAFSYCQNLASITIPDHITHIGHNAFYSTAWYNNQPEGFVYAGKVLYRYKGTMQEGTTIKVKEGTIAIADMAFQGNDNNWDWEPGIISINFPNSLTHIGAQAFYSCSNILSITLSANIKFIGDYAFSECNSLTTIYSQAKIAPHLENGTAFKNKYNTTAPEKTLFLLPDAMEYDIHKGWPTKQEKKHLWEENNVIYNVANVESKTAKVRAGNNFNSSELSIKQSIVYNGETYIVTNIEDNAFKEHTELTSVIIPSTIVHIGNRAFEGCTGLKSISIPENVISIGNYAFSNCYFSSITIPNSVTSIGNNAFYGCEFYWITLGKGINSLNGFDLNHYFELLSITVDDENETYSSQDGILFNKDKTSLLRYPAAKKGNYIIPNSITTIASSAFSSCEELESVVIPHTVTSIKSSAFSYCSSLRGIRIPNSITTIASSTFSGCNNLTSVVIPSSVTSIENQAFYNTNVTELAIPFVYTPLFSSKLKKLAIGAICTEIPSGSLSECINLQELTLPFLTVHPDELFGGTTPQTLEKLTITQPAKQLPSNVLSGCSMLKTLDIASSINSLGEKALYGCSGLTDIYSRWAYPPAAYNESTFTGVNKFACTIHVPTGSKQFYEKADGWKEFYTIQEEAPLVITALPVPLYGGEVNGLREHNHGEEVTLEAIANLGYEFRGWMEDEHIISTDRQYTFTVTDTRTLYAVFTPKENADEKIRIQAAAESAVISWTAVEDAETYSLVLYSDINRTREITRFQLDANGNVLRVATQELSCSIPHLDAGSTYYYSLISYDSEDCKLSISNGNFSTTTVGLDSLEQTSQVAIYPNPVTDILRITGLTEQTPLIISDISGKKVMSLTIAPEESITTDHLSKGIYLVSIGNKTIKMVKE